VKREEIVDGLHYLQEKTDMDFGQSKEEKEVLYVLFQALQNVAKSGDTTAARAQVLSALAEAEKIVPEQRRKQKNGWTSCLMETASRFAKSSEQLKSGP
jgi:hypothetical protein